MRTWLVTGGAGFIGSNLVRMLRAEGVARVINLDKLTYAGHGRNLEDLAGDNDHIFVQGDIADRECIDNLFSRYRPDAVINLAAESHVDRSIVGPRAFIDTNVTGTLNLLECALRFWKGLRPPDQKAFRFLHVSTDEVYGNLESLAPAFTEDHPYKPNSPYAASKAAADHLVRAYRQTFGLPTLVTNCTNNYGPRQHPEKLIPVLIITARSRSPLPIYGDGKQVRDWIHVDDHCHALRLAVEKGRVGETYNIGARCERSNLEVATTICRILDDLYPSPVPHARLIRHVMDRPGHDRRYAMDATKFSQYTGWVPQVSFEEGIARAVRWYLDHPDWIAVLSGEQHQEWMQQNYQQRGGTR